MPVRSALCPTRTTADTTSVSMQRMAVRNFTPSDGSILPAGTQVMVAKQILDPNGFSGPHTFDLYRFLRDREKSEEKGQPTISQHVSVTAQHMAWAYVEHSCPGRFFASNELKIAPSHLLLKYDWKCIEDSGPAFVELETSKAISLRYKVMFRRRKKEEISLDLEEILTESV